MILVIILLILCGPALVRSAEDSRRRAEAERRQAERAAELERRQAERIQEAERKRAEAERKRAEAEQRRDRIAAEARTMIEFWEPRRRDLIRRINAEQDAWRRDRLEAQLFQVEQRLQKAYWTLEN